MDEENLLATISSDEEAVSLPTSVQIQASAAKEAPISPSNSAMKHLPTPPTPLAIDVREDTMEELDNDDDGDRKESISASTSSPGIVRESPFWCQSVVPMNLYRRERNGEIAGTTHLHTLLAQFEEKVLGTLRQAKESQPRSDPPSTPALQHSCSTCRHTLAARGVKGPQAGNAGEEDEDSSSSGSSSSESSDSSESGEISDSEVTQPVGAKEDRGPRGGEKVKEGRQPEREQLPMNPEVARKRAHPAALHSDLCFNEPGQMNDGPYCKCSWLSRQTGVRHDKFAGELPISPKCVANANNLNTLYHYVLSAEPNCSEFARRTTTIEANGLVYEFEGFSLFFHRELPTDIPSCVSSWRFGYHGVGPQLRLNLLRENPPESFTIAELEAFHSFLFTELLELYDLNRTPTEAKDVEESCPIYHCAPRFVRKLDDGGKEFLPMSSVLQHLTRTFAPLVDSTGARRFQQSPPLFREFAQKLKDQLVVNPLKKPACIRADVLNAPEENSSRSANSAYPTITHFGVRASAYAYSRRSDYQRAFKALVRQRHLLRGKSRVTNEERQQLEAKQARVNKLKEECSQRRDIVVSVSSEDFYATGLYPDVVHHVLLVVLAASHVRFHCSLKVFEEKNIGYVFKNRQLLQLALTHPSYRTNYGTIPDHVRNTRNNCGIRVSRYQQLLANGRGPRGEDGAPTATQPEQVKLPTTRKRGINALLEVMAMQPSKASSSATQSTIRHNERLEFLGDAVVEFITTIHLFFMFPELEEGGLATYRTALVQNKHLATLAQKIDLHRYMLYAHGPDLCHETDLRHAMADAFEALMAAVFLDDGIDECDRIFSSALYGDEPALHKVWCNLPKHPLKRDTESDRQMIAKVPCLGALAEFEESIGVRFKHIRLLAKAFTRRNVPFNYLTLGDHQRLEFLGDTVLQLITSDYLYRHFPLHQEGHLSLLRTCLVSNKTQSVVCDDLAMPKYLVIPQILRKGAAGKSQQTLRMKDKADLVEAFLGALFVDRGWEWCKTFCRACFFPRLKYFIITQQWNDPKSQLQQCCLALRDLSSGEPAVPEYKTVGVEGPTNTRIYRVVVYFRNKRLAEGEGPSIQQAQMNAAERALIERSDLFPSLIRHKVSTKGSASTTLPTLTTVRPYRRVKVMRGRIQTNKRYPPVRPSFKRNRPSHAAMAAINDRPSTSRVSIPTSVMPVRFKSPVAPSPVTNGCATTGRRAKAFNPYPMENSLLLKHHEKQRRIATSIAATSVEVRPKIFQAQFPSTPQVGLNHHHHRRGALPQTNGHISAKRPRNDTLQ